MAVDVANLLLAVLVFFYSLNIGPMMFESYTSDRTWAAHPPDSFAMFLGPYGQKTAHYWRVVSPLASISFVLALAFKWRAPGRRWWLVAALFLYIAIQAATNLYFVPEQDRLIVNAATLSPDVLKAAADRWLTFNIVRNVAAVAAFACLLRAAFIQRVP